MKFALSLIALILLALIVPFFIPGAGKARDAEIAALKAEIAELKAELARKK